MPATPSSTLLDGNIVAVGHAHEVKTASNINKTSYVENCETSAVGRALAMLGIGIDVSIASANEVQDAIAKQDSSRHQRRTCPRRTRHHGQGRELHQGLRPTSRRHTTVSSPSTVSSSPTSRKLDSKSLYDEQHTEISAGLCAGLDDALPAPVLLSHLRWRVHGHTPLFQ